MKNQSPIKIKSNPPIIYEDVIQNVYSLGDSELISKMILDSIINYVLHRIRINYVNSLKKDFTLGYTFTLLEDICKAQTLNLDNTQDDLNSLIYIHEVEKSRIDNWASNKLGVGSYGNDSKIKDEKLYNIFFLSDENPTKNFFSLKKIKNKEFSSKKKNKPIKIFDEIDENLFEEKEKTKLEMKKKTVFKVETIKSFFRSGTIDSEDNLQSNQIDLVPLPTACVVNNDIYFGKEEEKAIEIYFRQREMDKLRKKKMEHDQIEENERKKKKINDDYLPYLSYDMDGNFIKPIVQNPDKLRHLLESKYRIRTQEQMKKIKDSKIKGKFEKISKKTEKKTTPPKLRPIYLTEEKVEEPNPELYFQPDPLYSITLSEGVNLESYNRKKEGEKYKNIEKMDTKLFNQFLTEYEPKRNQLIIKEERKNDTRDEYIKELDEEYLGNENSNRNSKVMMILTTDEDTLVDGNRINKDKYSTNLRKSEMELINNKINTRNPISKIKKINQDKIVNTNSNFNLNTIDYMDDDKLFQKWGNNQSKHISYEKHKNITILPKSHGNIYSELGHLSKFPRDRKPREFLKTSGKFIISKENQKVTNEITKPKY